MIVVWCRIINSILVTFVGKDTITIAEPDQTYAYLSNEAVQAKLRERYGDRIPRHEKVISPAAMFASDKLETVIEND